MTATAQVPRGWRSALQPPDRPPLLVLPARMVWPRAAGLLTVLLGWDAFEGAARFCRLAGWGSVPIPQINTAAPALIVAGLWLVVLEWRNGSRRAWVAAGIVPVGAALWPDHGATAETAGVLLLAVVCVWLCLEVAADAGIPRWQAGIMPPWANSRQTTAVLIASFAGIYLSSFLWLLLSALPGPQINGQGQGAALGITDSAHLLATAATAGLREEFPLLVGLVLLLTAARRPAWQIYTLAALLRVIPHGYVGLPALSAAVFGLVNVWLYRRTGRLGPIVAAHTTYNLPAVGAALLSAEGGA